MKYRGKIILEDSRKSFPTVGKPFYTVGNHFPWWEIFVYGGISSLPSLQTLIHRGGGHRPPPQRRGGQTLWMGVWRLSKQEIPTWKMISHRGKGFPTVENCFPRWESFPTVSTVLTLSSWPYQRFLKCVFILNWGVGRPLARQTFSRAWLHPWGIACQLSFVSFDPYECIWIYIYINMYIGVNTCAGPGPYKKLNAQYIRCMYAYLSVFCRAQARQKTDRYAIAMVSDI